MPLDSDPAQEPAEDVVTTGFRLQPVPLLAVSYTHLTLPTILLV